MSKEELLKFWCQISPAVWRYVRVFLSTFLTSLSVQVSVMTMANFNKAFMMSLLFASASAGVSAVFKALRDNSSGTLLEVVNKLPL